MSSVIDLMYDDASRNGVPIGGTFELTPLCNMNCRMCYIRMSRDEMEKQGRMLTAAQWLKLAEDAKNAGMLFLLLTGGEPFLYPGFRELYTQLKKMGFFVSINSNGTLLEGELLEWLIKDPPYRINITLYGASDEAYRELCGYDGGYSKVSEAIRRLKEAGVYVKLNGTLTPFNRKEIPKCFTFAQENNVPIEIGTYMFPPMRRDDKSFCRLDASDAGKYSARIDRLRYDDETFSARADEIKKCLQNGSVSDMPAKFGCRAGRSSFWINWKGEMTPCGMLEAFRQDPLETGFDECWKRIKSNIDNCTALSGCVSCEKRDICKVCPAIAYSEMGDFCKKPEYLCEYTESRIKEFLSLIP